MTTDNIPTTALPIIHDLDVIRVDVRMSALEPGIRAEFERLTAQVHQARRERDAAREGAQDCRDQLDEIRREFGAGPGVSVLEAVVQAQGEHAETLTALAKARQERNEARAELSIGRDITRELRASLKIPNGVSLTGTVKRLAEERDEAKADRIIAHNAMVSAEEARAKALRERDQARRDCNDLRSRLMKILPSWTEPLFALFETQDSDELVTEIRALKERVDAARLVLR